MGLFSKNKSSSNADQRVQGGLNRLWTRAPTRDKSELPELSHKNPRLDPVTVISQAVASTPWHIYDKVDLRENFQSAKPIIDDPIYDLIDYPMRRYPEMDGYFLIYVTMALVELVGEFFWIKIRDNPKGPPTQLYPCPPAWIAQVPTVTNNYFMVYPYGTTAGTAFPVAQPDMVWFKKPDLSDPYSRGRGNAEQLEDEYQTDEYLAKMQKNFAYNDATPPFVITAPGATPQSIADIKKGWMQKLGGWLHHREPGVLPWDAKIQTIAQTMVEMDFIESRKFLRDEATQHFRIPPEIFGNIQNSNRSTINSSFYLFNKNVVCYELRFLERAINRQLISIDFDEKNVFSFDEIIDEDEDYKLQVMNSGLINGVITVDEWRTAFKLSELPNGKGKVRHLTFNIMEVKESEEVPVTEDVTDKPTKLIPEPKPENAVPDQIVDGEGKQIIIEVIKKSEPIIEIEKTKEPIIKIVHREIEIIKNVDIHKNERRLAIWKAFDNRATNKESDFISAVQRFAKVQNDLVIKAIKEELKGTDDYQKAVDKALDLVFKDKENVALKRALAPAWVASMESGREHAYDILGNNKDLAIENTKAPKKPTVNPNLELTNEKFNIWIEKYGLLKAKEINNFTNETLRKNLQAVISDGIDNGFSSLKIAKNIYDAADEVYSYLGTEGKEEGMSRARKIARTETATSVNYGTLETYASEGVESSSWNCVGDDRARQEHIDADGKVAKIGESFNVGGEELGYPGDPDGSAENVINCRCFLVAEQLGDDE